MKTAEISAFAPAKINLTLHVTGRRADGYHLLDSLVVFADIGDHLHLRPARGVQLKVSGPMADGVPLDDSNLVLRAARAAGVMNVAIHLEKNLPAAAGIGGGSSDAAAVLRALGEGWGATARDPSVLGSDLPVCMGAQTARMAGIGDIVTPVNGIPSLPAVLVNPRLSLPTPTVFAGLLDRDASPMGNIPTFPDVESCASWLHEQRNDLEASALRIAPVIGDCLDMLTSQNALIARMSGSGATCFGLFATQAAAVRAAAALKTQQPTWWIRQTILAG